MPLARFHDFPRHTNRHGRTVLIHLSLWKMNTFSLRAKQLSGLKVGLTYNLELNVADVVIP